MSYCLRKADAERIPHKFFSFHAMFSLCAVKTYVENIPWKPVLKYPGSHIIHKQDLTYCIINQTKCRKVYSTNCLSALQRRQQESIFYDHLVIIIMKTKLYTTYTQQEEMILVIKLMDRLFVIQTSA